MDNSRDTVWFLPSGVFYRLAGQNEIIRWDGSVSDFVAVLSREDFIIGDAVFYVQDHDTI